MPSFGWKSGSETPRATRGPDGVLPEGSRPVPGRKVRRPSAEAALSSAVDRLGEQALTEAALPPTPPISGGSFDGLPPLPPSEAAPRLTAEVTAIDARAGEIFELMASVLSQMSDAERHVILGQCIGEEHAVIAHCVRELEHRGRG